MATSKWQIYDVVDTDVQGQASGEVELVAVQVAPDIQRWAVRMPDQTLVLLPSPGGTVDLPEALPADKVERRGDDNSTRIRHFVKVSLVLLFGFGFVAIILHDLKSGSLTFDKYMTIIAAFTGGLGAAASLGK